MLSKRNVYVGQEYNMLGLKVFIKKGDHWLTQFQSFDWLSGHEISAIISCPRNSGTLNRLLIFLAKYNNQDLIIFLGCFNKIFIPLVPFGLIWDD